MGIEVYWKEVKESYRPFVRTRLAAGLTWNQELEIGRLLREVPTPNIKKAARKGLKCLEKAVPVDPNKHEEQYCDLPELKIKKGFLQQLYGK